MAIQEITDVEIVQRCAGCDRENRVALANLAVGVEHAEQVEDGVVPLPECPTCRSREFLVRSPASEQAHPSQGSSGHLHRLMVDELHSQASRRVLRASIPTSSSSSSAARTTDSRLRRGGVESFNDLSPIGKCGTIHPTLSPIGISYKTPTCANRCSSCSRSC